MFAKSEAVWQRQKASLLFEGDELKYLLCFVKNGILRI